VAFNVNYFRPHVFGLEAVREVTAFVAAFDPEIDDPQMKGMGKGPYTPAGFLSGWNAGNRSAYDAIGKMEEADLSAPPRMPRARLESYWIWNVHRALLQDLLGSVEMLPCFVPKIFVAQVSGRARTGVIWDATIPILLPEVDAVFVPTDDGLRDVPHAAL